MKMDPLKMSINLLKMVIVHETMFVNTRGFFLFGQPSIPIHLFEGIKPWSTMTSRTFWAESSALLLCGSVVITIGSLVSNSSGWMDWG